MGAKGGPQLIAGKDISPTTTRNEFCQHAKVDFSLDPPERNVVQMTP